MKVLVWLKKHRKCHWPLNGTNKTPVELGRGLMRVDSHALLWGGGDISKQLTKVAANFDTLSSRLILKGQCHQFLPKNVFYSKSDLRI
jgi:hypothetical protein